MIGKPATFEGYSGEDLRLVRSVCLYAATVLGDLLDDLVIVGGLAPSLLGIQEPRSEQGCLRFRLCA